jgi:hypothetical protein
MVEFVDNTDCQKNIYNIIYILIIYFLSIRYMVVHYRYILLGKFNC